MGRAIYPQPLWLDKFQNELRGKKLKPLFVQWVATKKCNFKCGYCGTGSGEGGEDELSTREILKAIDGLSKLGCQYLSVTGGEPLIREDIFEVLSHAKRKGIEVSLVTNGYLTDKYILELKKLRLHAVSVSIDGYRERHDKNRKKKGSYKKCLEALKAYRKIGVDVIQACTVVLKNNIEDIPGIITDVFANGCTRYRLQLLIPEGRAKLRTTPEHVVEKALRIIYKARQKGLRVFAADTFGYMGEAEEKLRGYDFFCGCGWRTFTIMHNGNIMGCPAIDLPEFSEGNIRDKGIEGIWWNKFERFRKTFIADLPDECKKCGYISICRGGCWAQRVNNGRFCYLKIAKKITQQETLHERRTNV